VIQILIGLAGLGLMVFIHELGHFFAARALGIEVEAFALGWGPTLLKYKGKRTEYRLAAFPLGGYCKMKGEQDMADALQNKKEVLEASSGSFFAAKPWRRIIVVAAGPLVNLVFALIVMTLVWFIGFSYTSTDNRIVLPSDYHSQSGPSDPTMPVLDTTASPAALAGLKSGDRIVAINGSPTESFRDIQMGIAVAAKQKVTLSIDRDGTNFETSLEPLLDTQTGAGRIGIRQWIEPVVEKVSGGAASGGILPGDRILSVGGTPIVHIMDLESAVAASRGAVEVVVDRQGTTQKLNIFPDYTKDSLPNLDIQFKGKTFHSPRLNLFQAAARGTKEAVDAIVLTARSIGLLFQGLDPTKAVSGPIRITYYVGEVATQGFSISFSEGIRSFFHFLSLISIALFFGNLLPIPALDGGQIVLFIWETISRRPLRPKLVQRYQIVGVVLVFGMLLLAISGDILFMFGK